MNSIEIIQAKEKFVNTVAEKVWVVKRMTTRKFCSKEACGNKSIVKSGSTRTKERSRKTEYYSIGGK